MDSGFGSGSGSGRVERCASVQCGRRSTALSAERVYLFAHAFERRCNAMQCNRLDSTRLESPRVRPLCRSAAAAAAAAR